MKPCGHVRGLLKPKGSFIDRWGSLGHYALITLNLQAAKRRTLCIQSARIEGMASLYAMGVVALLGIPCPKAVRVTVLWDVDEDRMLVPLLSRRPSFTDHCNSQGQHMKTKAAAAMPSVASIVELHSLGLPVPQHSNFQIR